MRCIIINCGKMVLEIFNIYNFVEALWIIIPAYAANGLAPLINGRHPIDGDRLFRGKPVLGKGKTWEGLLFGTFIAGVIGLVEQLAFSYLPFEISPVPLNIVPMSFQFGLFLGLGAMTGDIIASFFKRRLGMKRGQSAPVLDQDDFIVGSLVFASAIVRVEFSWWVLLLVFTPVFHLVANRIGYWIKVKPIPY